ncbi:type II toxin-antitoxin system HicA family toxin [Methanoculleus sp. FWC-SCC1]|uniref:Type II toxin-antitoxin system HicA family toxin n=1 Tax=Methanoculleus frigidifontis TaxID=2584085 RepID=A0ABT8M7X1_9EURY|nr:type II toxin-antitoxin system HicA family toxin [Methanoculleus sp. FWC-SCC1]
MIKILSKRYGFVVTGQSGSHVRLSKTTPDGKVGVLTTPLILPYSSHAFRTSGNGSVSQICFHLLSTSGTPSPWAVQ